MPSRSWLSSARAFTFVANVMGGLSALLLFTACKEDMPPLASGGQAGGTSGAAGTDGVHNDASTAGAGGVCGSGGSAGVGVGMCPNVDGGADSPSNDGAGPLVPGTVGITVADYMMATWPELDGTASDCTGPGNCFSMNFATAPAAPAPKFWEYTYGVPVYGIQRLFQRTGQSKYFDYVKKYVDRYIDANGTINYARSLSVTVPPVVADETIVQDVIQPSILLFGLYETTHDPRYLTAMASVRKVFRSIPKNSDGAFYHKPTYPNQQWLDGIYMGEPFIAKYGALYAEQAIAGDAAECFGTATSQIKVLAAHTFNPDKSLYYHAWNDAADGKWLGLAPPSKTPPLDGTVVSPVLWARSIAWFIAGIVDVLDDLPADHADRPQLVEIVNNIAAGLKRYQDKDTGLWYEVVDVMGDQPASGGYPSEGVPGVANWLETSASALFAYSLAKGVRLGVLPVEYLAVGRAAWAGVKSKVDINADGTVVIHGTVVGLSVGGTYNAYTNADFRGVLDGSLPAPAPADTCPTTGVVGTSAPLACKYIYVRDNVPQGFGAVLLAASEIEF